MSVKLSRFLIVAFLLSTAMNVTGIELQGFGSAKDVETAKTFALKDLASGIEIRIVAASNASEGYYRDTNVESYAVDIDTDAVSVVDIPIYGAEFTVSPKNERGEYSVKVTVQSEKAIPLYITKIEELTAELHALNDVQLTQFGNRREESLRQLFAGVKLFKKYRSMLMVLGYDPLPESPYPELVIKAEIVNLQNLLDTIPKAAAYLAKDIRQSKIYVFPPKAPSSSEITDFASIMQGALNAELNTVMSSAMADYVLKGAYYIGQGQIDIHYSLIPIKGRNAGTIVESVSAQIQEEAYAGINYQPSSLNIDTLISEGLAIAPQFRITATTSQGKNNLLFREDEDIELLVKMNAPGYFYGLCHVDSPDGKYSYMLDINGNESGDRRFVYYVSPDDVNKWIVLKKIQTSIPHGVERIQLYASAADPIDALPTTELSDDRFIVVGDSQRRDSIRLSSGPNGGTSQKSDDTTLIYTVMP